MVGGMWLTSACGWVCRGAAAVIVVAFCVVLSFEFKSLCGPGEPGKLLEQARVYSILGITLTINPQP